MLDIFKERLHQKYRTLDFPRKAPGLSPRYMGRARPRRRDRRHRPGHGALPVLRSLCPCLYRGTR